MHLDKKTRNTIDLEIQRRLWWHLIYLDAEAALLTGLPILIHEDDYTTCMPSEADDSSIDRYPVSPNGNLTFPMMVAMKSRCHCT